MLAFDVGTDVPTEAWWGKRDQLMADVLARHAEVNPRSAMVVLVRSVHASRVRAVPWDSTFVPMANVLSARLGSDRLSALRMAYEAGSVWQWREAATEARPTVCQANSIRASPGAAAWTIALDRRQPASAWDGVWGVGSVAASPPAVLPDAMPRVRRTAAASCRCLTPGRARLVPCHRSSPSPPNGRPC